MVQLRGWQREAYAQYQSQVERRTKSCLWEATPGAGKTTAALQVIRHQLRHCAAKRALVVVPTSHLRIQWARAAHQLGTELDFAFGGKRFKLTDDYAGAVVTYQQIAVQPKQFQRIAAQAVVVLDEVHHAGDGLAWGDSIRSALDEAQFILCLSGTAFRSDCNPIPFVSYDASGLSLPDYTYSYAQAVQEKVCRPTAVFTYGGEVSWSENDQTITAGFNDALDSIAASRRLRAALDPDAGWIEPLLIDAQAMLIALRNEQPDAGALIVCADRDHARKIARLVAATSGEKPTVVLSDDRTASKKIKQYADSNGQWLVACNMVSEGVDIPRLRLGVYATTVRTKLYFRQFVGRIVRRRPFPRGPQVAYLYLPADPELRRFAEEIEAEVRHCLNKRTDFYREEREEQRSHEPNDKTAWAALEATNSGLEAVIVHGNQLALFETADSPVAVRAALDQEVELHLTERLTRSEEKLRLASEIKRLVGFCHRRFGTPHSVIHSTLNRLQGVKSQLHCTEEQLHSRLRLVEEMCRRGRVPG